ncbi:DUF2946 family protein [Algiphilus sp.]|uniref:DUF2946 family protein n=1 Tax=Algiphilus sp. TaxID=1872431 RepID=UPI0025BD9A8D|nr:DUF2946 family protein [Algiphilus sp.]MCK5770709.1 hypothetical protein [Algiphilus sp.]
MRRPGPVFVWLGIIAMLCQLLLPSAHALTYAQRAGDPLAFAWCGTGAVALAASVRDGQAAGAQDDAARLIAELPQCSACATAHAAAAPSADVAIEGVRPSLAPPAATIAGGTIPAAPRALRPPSRAPPIPA